MPGNAGKHADIAAPVSWPPGLAFSHQCTQVALQCFYIQLLEFFGVVEVLTQRVGLAVVLVKNVEVECIRPPIAVGLTAGCHCAMHDRAFARRRLLVIHNETPILLMGWSGQW